MSKTIHIEGYAQDIDLLEKLSNNYDFPNSFEFGEATTEVTPNVFFRFYDTKEKVTLDEAMCGHIVSYFGELSATGEEYGYSEYTVEGFSVYELKIGNHDLAEIIGSMKGKYLHILIDFL